MFSIIYIRIGSGMQYGSNSQDLQMGNCSFLPVGYLLRRCPCSKVSGIPCLLSADLSAGAPLNFPSLHLRLAGVQLIYIILH